MFFCASEFPYQKPPYVFTLRKCFYVEVRLEIASFCVWKRLESQFHFFFIRFIFVYSSFFINRIALLPTTHFQNRNPSTQTSTFDFSFILATKDADPRISSHQISIIYPKICDSKSTHTPVQPLSRTHTHTHGCAYTSMPRIPVFHQQISRNADSLHSVMRSRRCSFVPMFRPPLPTLK